MRTSSTAARLASASRKDASNAGVEARPSGGVSLMRTALCWTMSCLQARFRLWIGYMAIGLAVVVTVVPASSAQAPPVLGQGKAAGTGIEAEEGQTHDEMTDGLRSDA